MALDSDTDAKHADTPAATSGEINRLRSENEALRARVADLESLLASTIERDRALEADRSEAARRAAAALADAQRQLERLAAEDRAPESVQRRRPRGNWLQ
jgi:hypothetical protein